MPLDHREIELAAEADRLADQRDAVAEQQAPLDDDSERAQTLEQRGVTLDNYRRAVEWAREEWPAETITVAGLTAGEYGYLEDQLPEGAGGGMTRVYYVAAGLADAPPVEHDADAQPPWEDYEETVAAVSALPIDLVRYLEAQINGLTSVGGDEGNSYYASLVESRGDETSETTSGEPTS